MNKIGVALILTALGTCCLAFDQDSTILAPNVLNLVVGETHSIQALNPAGQSMTGLTWTSSDPAVVSLSTDDPPVLSALAAGHVAITAGTATADVTVYAGVLPLGTVIWSNPGNGSGVYSIVPAVPSSSGVADVFAFQDDGTVQAITSDGTTAWTADLSNAWPILPDFQGGLVAVDWDGASGSIVKFDGLTGQAKALYTADGTSQYLDSVGVHPDGTIFARLQQADGTPDSVIGLDPTTGSQKFNVPLPVRSVQVYGLVVAGDGYAYVPYGYRETYGDCNPCSADYAINHLGLMRIDSTGASGDFEVYTFQSPIYDLLPLFSPHMITNADIGILLTWDDAYRNEDGNDVGRHQMAITSGSSASMVGAPVVPGQNGPIQPMLQAQDGSFVGTAWVGDDWTPYMVAFDQGGGVGWSVAGERPQIATDDGGVIAQSGTIYDQSGTATGQIAANSVPNWEGQLYSTEVEGLHLNASWISFAAGFAAAAGGNPSGNGTAAANLGQVEGVPRWALSLLGHGGPTCAPLDPNSQPAPLAGAALASYTNARQALLTYLRSLTEVSSCATSPLSPYFSQLTSAVSQQVPNDGLLSNLSKAEAGVYSNIDKQIAEQAQTWHLYNEMSVCTDFWDKNSKWKGIVAEAQAQPPGINVYLVDQSNLLKYITQAMILHESLHNLTELGDHDLYTLLTGKQLGSAPTCLISVELAKIGCAQPNINDCQVKTQ